MKTNLFLLTLTFSACIVLAQNGAFIQFKMTSNKGASGNVNVNYSEFGSISETNLSMPQMPGKTMRTKFLVQKDKPGIIFTIHDDSKTYSEMTPQSRNDTKTYTVKKLGEETVNGYKCIHASISDGIETEEVWNTKDIPDYAKYEEVMKSDAKMSSARREQALRDAGCGGFPVKMYHKGDREGDMTVELVKLEKRTFPKSDFEIPAGYTKSGSTTSTGNSDVKSQQEIMNMTPEERAKYVEEMKKKYGK